MGGPGNDGQLHLAGHLGLRLAIEVENGVVLSRPRSAVWVLGPLANLRCGEVGAAAAANHGGDALRMVGRRPQRRRSSGGGAEVAEWEFGGRLTGRSKGAGGIKALGEKLDVKDVAAVGGFFLGEQIEQSNLAMPMPLR